MSGRSRLFLAALARRNRIPMRTSFWMAKEGADALIQLRTDDVLEFAGLTVRFGIFDGERVFEQSLGYVLGGIGWNQSNSINGAPSPDAVVGIPGILPAGHCSQPKPGP